MFVVTRTGTAAQPLEVHLSWGGTAVPGVDYNTPPTSVTLAAGSSELVLSAGITSTSANKTLVLTIDGGSGYAVGDPSTATAHVEVAVITPACAVAPATPPETSPTFTG
jgi:hypothetical protein